MSRGLQLPDLFDCLPTEEAQREFLHELEIIRSLCLKLLENEFAKCPIKISEPLVSYKETITIKSN